MTTLTREAIKSAFMKLLESKPLSKITVREIVEECGINRNSFYYHYNDIPSLLEEILTEEAENFVRTRSSNDSVYDCIIDAIDYAMQNKAVAMHIYNSANKEMYEQYLGRISTRAINEYINTYSDVENICEEDKAVIVMYYKSLFMGVISDWLNTGMKYDIKKNMKRVCELFEGTTEAAFERCRKNN